jgi:hypothetical protein
MNIWPRRRLAAIGLAASLYAQPLTLALAFCSSPRRSPSRSPASPRGVSLFERANFMGRAERWGGDGGSIEDTTRINQGAGFRSVRVPRGWEVVCYSERMHRGQSARFGGASFAQRESHLPVLCRKRRELGALRGQGGSYSSRRRRPRLCPRCPFVTAAVLRRGSPTEVSTARQTPVPTLSCLGPAVTSCW